MPEEEHLEECAYCGKAITNAVWVESLESWTCPEHEQPLIDFWKEEDERRKHEDSR